MAKRLKKKHRDRFWLDYEGDLWYWPVDGGGWVVLTNGGDGVECSRGVYTPDEQYGPYKRAFDNELD